MSDEYKSIRSSSEGIYREKGSKFIAITFPVYSIEECKQNLDIVKKKYHDARHHCYAYCLGVDREQYRINDDGEPSGSAGKPIYGQILSADLTNIMVIVVRYFGGTKLGIPGLIRAYKTSTKESIKNSTIIRKYVTDTFIITYSYENTNEVLRILNDFDITIISQDFSEDCKQTIKIRKKKSNILQDKIEKVAKIERS